MKFGTIAILCLAALLVACQGKSNSASPTNSPTNAAALTNTAPASNSALTNALLPPPPPPVPVPAAGGVTITLKDRQSVVPPTQACERPQRAVALKGTSSKLYQVPGGDALVAAKNDAANQDALAQANAEKQCRDYCTKPPPPICKWYMTKPDVANVHDYAPGSKNPGRPADEVGAQTTTPVEFCSCF